MGSWDKRVYIYVIIDPITMNPFYVGETSFPEKRFREHGALRSKACDVIECIKHNGGVPIFKIIDFCDNGNFKRIESQWMRYFIHKGFNIINTIRQNQIT